MTDIVYKKLQKMTKAHNKTYNICLKWIQNINIINTNENYIC